MGAQTTIRISAANLAAALGATIPFAAEVGYGIPSLESVQLTAGDGQFIAVATNRYVIGCARREAIVERPVRFLLGVSQARAVRNALTASMDELGTGQFEVAMVVTDNPATRTVGFHFEPYAMSFDEGAGAKNFPDLAKLLNQEVQPGATPDPGPVGLNPATLKPLLKATKWARNRPMRWSLGAAMKPARVEIDDWFVGLVMPTRLRDDVKPVQVVMPTTEAAGGAA